MGARFVSTVKTVERFRRCGHMFTRDGEAIPEERFTETEWARIEAEPMLLMRDATEKELEALDAARLAVEAEGDAELINHIISVVPVLEAGDFTQTGTPKLKALRAALESEVPPEAVTDAARDAAMEKLVEAGFIPPKAD